MLPLVFVVTLSAVVTGFILENDAPSEDSPSGGKPKRGVLRRASMSVAEAPRRLTRKVSSFLSDQDSQEPVEGRPRSFSGFTGSLSKAIAEAPHRLTRKVGFFLSDQDPQEAFEGRPRSFSGFAGKISGRQRTQSCPVTLDVVSDELNLNAMD